MNLSQTTASPDPTTLKTVTAHTRSWIGGAFDSAIPRVTTTRSPTAPNDDNYSWLVNVVVSFLASN